MARTKLPENLANNVAKLVKGLQALVFSGIKDNEMELTTILRGVQKALDALDSATAIHFAEAVYDNSVVYKAVPGEQVSNGETKMYQRSYTVDNDGNVTLADDVQEVRKNGTVGECEICYRLN